MESQATTTGRTGWLPPRRDIALALAVAALQVGAAVAISARSLDEGRRDIDALGAALPALSGLALLARRRHPVATFAVAMAATALYLHLGYQPAPVFWAMVVAFVTTMLQGRRVAAVAEISVGYVTFIGLATVDHGFNLGIAGALAAWLIVLLTGSELVRARGDRAREQERSREEEARRRVTEERLRIARELHDVVAHNISLVNLQAGVALHLLDQQPEQARTALATIKDASKEALVELRSVLGVLRQVDEDDDAPRAPTPGLARLDDLVAQSASAGVDVRVEHHGDRRALPAGLDLAAFRIVQEALTNVARHAGPTVAHVRLSYGDDALVVEVADDGRHRGDAGVRKPDATLGSGHGLAGMRERAEAVGGSVAAGPRPGFGWQVLAHLPYTASGRPPAVPAASASAPSPLPSPSPEPAPSQAGGRA